MFLIRFPTVEDQTPFCASVRLDREKVCVCVCTSCQWPFVMSSKVGCVKSIDFAQSPRGFLGLVFFCLEAVNSGLSMQGLLTRRDVEERIRLNAFLKKYTRHTRRPPPHPTAPPPPPISACGSGRLSGSTPSISSRLGGIIRGNEGEETGTSRSSEAAVSSSLQHQEG